VPPIKREREVLSLKIFEATKPGFSSFIKSLRPNRLRWLINKIRESKWRYTNHPFTHSPPRTLTDTTLSNVVPDPKVIRGPKVHWVQRGPWTAPAFGCISSSYTNSDKRESSQYGVLAINSLFSRHYDKLCGSWTCGISDI